MLHEILFRFIILKYYFWNFKVVTLFSNKLSAIKVVVASFSWSRAGPFLGK